MKPKAEAAEEAFSYIAKVMIRKANYYGAGGGRSAHKSYIDGFCYGVKSKFTKQNQSDQCFALMVTVEPEVAAAWVDIEPKKKPKDYKADMNESLVMRGYRDGLSVADKEPIALEQQLPNT